MRAHLPHRRLGLLCALLWLAPVPAGAVGVGDEAPAFQLPVLSGRGQVSLAAHRGKVVYLDFWASWCPPCLTSLPVLEELRKELPRDRFQIVAVNVDRDPRRALAFLERHPVGYPSGSDPQGVLPERFAIPTMPTSYLIDARGVVRHVHEGFRAGDGDALREKIRALLAEGGR